MFGRSNALFQRRQQGQARCCVAMARLGNSFVLQG
jgi:hypothetical protein